MSQDVFGHLFLTTYCLLMVKMNYFWRSRTLIWRTTLPPNSKPRSLCDLGFLFSVGFSMHADEAQERRSDSRHAGAVRERKALSAGHTKPCSIYSSTFCFIFFNIQSLVIPDFNGHTFFRIINRCLHYPRHKSEQVLNNLSCFISFSASSLA